MLQKSCQPELIEPEEDRGGHLLCCIAAWRRPRNRDALSDIIAADILYFAEQGMQTPESSQIDVGLLLEHDSWLHLEVQDSPRSERRMISPTTILLLGGAMISNVTYIPAKL